MANRIWLDTDIGTDVDDIVALSLALLSPEVDLVGVSTVYGDVALRSRMVRKVLDLAGRPDVPVLLRLHAPGAERAADLLGRLGGRRPAGA